MPFTVLDLWFPEIGLPLSTHWDPLFEALSRLLSFPLEFDSYAVFQLLIFVGGTFLLLRAAKANLLGSFLVTAALTAALIRVFGDQLTVLGIHWFPYLVFSALLCRCLPSLLSVLLLIVTGFLWTVSAGPLGLLGVLLALPLGSYHCHRNHNAGPSLVFFVLTSTLLIANIFIVPVFTMPAYPPGAHLSELSQLTLQPYPWIGPALVPNPVRFDFHHALFPIPSLRMVIPGLALLPYFWFTAPLFVCAFVLLCPGWRRHGLKLAFGFLALFAVFGQSWLGKPFATEELKSSDLREKLSKQVAASVGDWAMEPASVALHRNAHEILAAGLLLDAQASVAGQDAALAIDGDIKTRWSTGRPQEVGDKFSVKLAKPTKLSSVLLLLGTHDTDFPRGIRVGGVDAQGQKVEVASYPRWDGALSWTDSDFPYFGPQSEVRLRFREPHELIELEFELLQGDSHYDWAIAEIKLFE